MSSFLDGGGELGALMRAYDWTKTPLGPPASWPRSLKTAVRIMLTSRQPFWLAWGRDLTYLYNDPYLSIIGGKHRHARRGHLRRGAAAHHAAPRLPGRDLLHLFLQPDPRRRRRDRRHHLREHG